MIVEPWDPGSEPAEYKITAMGWLRIAVRAPILALVVFGGLAVLLMIRLIERPLCGADRPVTPWITQGVCRTALRIMGLPLHVEGKALTSKLGVVVANHASWLDIFALNSRKNIYFVSKAEVAGWPGIGWLARATGTVFIKRDRKEARFQTQLFRERLSLGHRLLFFPEGTSTDGRRVLPFKTTLFQAFFDESLKDELEIQVVSVVYHAPAGADARFYGWWGDMDFGPSLLNVLAQSPQGAIELVYHQPVAVADFANRKALAAHLEAELRTDVMARLSRGIPKG
jgi:1-acyl-sn-glycerol-3-phosphate acyltransferase